MTDPNPQHLDGNLKSLNALFQSLRGGAMMVDLAEALTSVVAAVSDTGKKGTLTLEIEVKPATTNKNNALVFADEIKIKFPKPERDQTIMFANANMVLSRRDSSQPNLIVDNDVQRGDVRDFPFAPDGDGDN